VWWAVPLGLIRHWEDECGRVLELIHQLQLPGLQDGQEAEILAELVASTIHLHTHCDKELQTSLADELKRLSMSSNPA
jgi:hypothetical protein